LTTYFFGDLIR